MEFCEKGFFIKRNIVKGHQTSPNFPCIDALKNKRNFIQIWNCINIYIISRHWCGVFGQCAVLRESKHMVVSCGNSNLNLCFFKEFHYEKNKPTSVKFYFYVALNKKHILINKAGSAYVFSLHSLTIMCNLFVLL